MCQMYDKTIYEERHQSPKTVMIKSIRLKNFFSFSAATIELNQMNALIGINGSGKSNFLKAINVLKAVVVEGGLSDLIINQWGGFEAVCFSGKTNQPNPHIELEFEFDKDALQGFGYTFYQSVFYQIHLYKVPSTQNFSIEEYFYKKNEEERMGYIYLRMANGKGFVRESINDEQVTVNYQLEDSMNSILSQLVDKDRYYHIFALREAIKSIAVYSYFDTSIKSAIRKPGVFTSAIRLASDGANLPQLLNRIKINNKADYNAIKQAFTTVNPNYTDFDYNIMGTNIELMLEEASLNRSVHVTHISDGTLRYLCLLSIIYNVQRGVVVCIDEPEVGLHPDMIYELMAGMKSRQSETQFIVSTHNENVLNQFSVEDVLVCEKNEENATTLSVFRDEEFKQWAAAYATGRLWRNGDLGGNRYLKVSN